MKSPAHFKPVGALRRFVEYGTRLDRLDEVVSTFEELYPQVFSEPPPNSIGKKQHGLYRTIALALLQNGDIKRGEPLMRAYLNAQDREDAAAGNAHPGAIVGRLALGEREAALTKFRRYAELKWIWHSKNTLRYSRLFDPIRDEPEFIELMEFYARNDHEQRQLLEAADLPIPTP